MRTVEQVEKEIGEVQEKVALVRSEIESKQGEVEQLKRSSALLTEQSLGKRRPKGLEVQRNRLASLLIEIENLEVVGQNLQERLGQLGEERELVQLYGQVKDYKTKEQVLFSAFGEVNEALEEIEDKIQVFKGKVEAFSKAENATLFLQAIFSELRGRRLSVRAFFEQGAIEMPTPEVDAVFIEGLIKRYVLQVYKLTDLNEIGKGLMLKLASVDASSLRQFENTGQQKTTGRYLREVRQELPKHILGPNEMNQRVHKKQRMAS